MIPAPDFWQHKGIVSYLLWPFSIVYYLLMKLDRLMKSQKQYVSTLPVISVGNITVGGSGKSPVTAFIAEKLLKQGEKVAILSRGYGAEIQGNKQVESSNRPVDVGDEPLMLKKQLPKAQVWVGKDRAKSAQLAQEAGATCLLLDDGFQNWRLARDVDIILLDSMQGVGNGFMLPAGCLREPVSAMERADIKVAMNGDMPRTDISLNLMVNNKDIRALKGRKVLAFSGIGIPEKFFNSLRNAGIVIVGDETFPDHHLFSDEELTKLKNRAEKLGAVLVTTLKDAVKLPENFAQVVHVGVEGDVKQLMQQINTAIEAKRQV